MLSYSNLCLYDRQTHNVIIHEETHKGINQQHMSNTVWP